MPRDIEEVVDDLITLYTEKFGGKLKGRYKISRENLAHLSVRVSLQEVIIDKIRVMMLEEGYSFIKVFDEDGTSYIIIDNKIFTNYREVPLRLIRQCIKEAEDKEDVS